MGVSVSNRLPGDAHADGVLTGKVQTLPGLGRGGEAQLVMIRAGGGEFPRNCRGEAGGEDRKDNISGGSLL